MARFYDKNLVEAMKTRKFIANSSANGTDTLEVYETEIYIDSDSTYTEALTLPSVAAAKGKVYSIYMVDDGGHCIVYDQDDAIGWSDLTSTADGDYLILYSDGRSWRTLATNNFA